WIQSLQISANGGGTIIQNFADGLQVQLDSTATLSNSALGAFSQAWNLPGADVPLSSTGPGYTIPNAGASTVPSNEVNNLEYFVGTNSRRYYMPIRGFWEFENGFPMALLDGPIQIQIITGPSCLDTSPTGVTGSTN